MPNPSGPMACPVDGTTLVMSERSGIEIDYCPQCRGVWLDRGELDKIIERNAEAGAPPRGPRPALARSAAPAGTVGTTPARPIRAQAPQEAQELPRGDFRLGGRNTPATTTQEFDPAAQALCYGWTRQAGKTPMKITTTLAAAIGLVALAGLRRP